MSTILAWLRRQYGYGPAFARDTIRLAQRALTEEVN